MATETKVVEMWEKTNDKVGIRPKQPKYCPICALSGMKVEMALRRSRLHRVADVRVEIGIEKHRPYAFDVAMKCPACDFYCVFGVPTDIEYAQKVIQERDNSVDHVLPLEDWEEDGRVKKRLAKWGYW